MNITEKRETIKILESIAEQKRNEIQNRRSQRVKEVEKNLRQNNEQLFTNYSAILKEQKELEQRRATAEKALNKVGFTRSYYKENEWECAPSVDFSAEYKALNDLVDQTRIAIWGSDSVILSEVIEKLKEI